MPLSKKPIGDKKPISAAKLAELLKTAKAPKVQVELPKLTEVPTTYQPRPKINIPEDIAPATSDATKVTRTIPELKTFDEVLDNTIIDQSVRMGIEAPKKDSHFYNRMKDDILKNKENFTTIEGFDGKKIFGLKRDFADSFMAGLNDFEKTVDEGIDFAFSDKEDNIKKLNQEYSFKPQTTLRLGRDNSFGLMLGGMIKPLKAGLGGAMTGAVVGAATTGPAAPLGAGGGAVLGFATGVGTTFALSAPEGVSYAYGYSLKENYFKLKMQGLSDDEAYDKANTIARASAGGETLMQGVYAAFGAPGTTVTSSIPKTTLFSQGSKSGFASASAKFVNNANKFVKPAKDFVAPSVFIGTEAALSKGISEAESIKQGVEKTSEEAVENSIKYGSDFAVMDMGIRGLLGIFKIPAYLKSQTKNMMLTADRNVVRDFVKTGEDTGVYPKGSADKILSDLNEQAKAKDKSPKFPGDEAREAVVSGLTLKLNKLVDEQSKLADVHKADLQPQIDDITKRIEIAKKSNNPLEAEFHEDGTPLVTTKTVDNATKETTGEVKEVLPESGIPEREGVVSKQQKEAGGQKAANETGTSDSPVSGTEEVAPTVSFADKIRRFKIDESILTGGDKGVAQTNIVGLPIAIYNASIEAIAKGVEAGGVLAELIEQQVKALKEGGYKLDETKFRKSVGLIDRAASQKAVKAAEQGMEGINSTDYAYLQRYALEKYNDPTGIYRDPENMAKALRDELNKKMDTSNISDDTFEMLAYDAVANQSQAPFTPKPATKVTIDGVDIEPEQIITNPKEIFKAMYTAATKTAKDVGDRVLGAANMISEYIKKKDKLNVSPKDISKAIGKFVTSKMDSETAAEVFAENLSDIIETARDANQIAANKATIKKIRKEANSPTYGTIASKQMTDGIEFMSPNKIKDTVNPDNPNEVLTSSIDKRKQYQELLDDYRNSITGKPTKSKTARLDLIDFIERERKNFDEFQERALGEKKVKAGKKYDKLVAENKISETDISREQFIEAEVNPTKAVSDDVERVVNEAEADKVEAYKEVVENKRNELRQEKDAGDIDPSDADNIEFLLNAPLDKISPRNLKLMAVMIDDVLNGERTSRIGELRSDVAARNGLEKVTSLVTRIRDAGNKIKYAGITRGFLKMVKKGYEGAYNAFEEYGITNMVRALTVNNRDSNIFRSEFLGSFEKNTKLTNTSSRQFTETFSKIFSSKSVKIDGNVYSFKGIPALTDMNSHKIGTVAALLNYENPLNTINSIIESTKILNEIDSPYYKNIAQERIAALKDMGLIDISVSTADDIRALQPLESIDVDAIINNLNARESTALQFLIGRHKQLAPSLNNVTRDYFGFSVDMSNPNYIPQTTFFTDEVTNFTKEFEEPIFNYENVNKMRASSTMQRSAQMISPTSSKGRVVHYDLDIFKTQPKKFHESLNTIMTTADTRNMAKMFASKEFRDYISGKLNIEPKNFQENIKMFKNIVIEYVNGERKPYVVTKEIQNQRSFLSRFFYSRLLNSLEAGALQYLPNVPGMIMESPQSWAKSISITTKGIYDDATKEALVGFLSQTSKANRLNAGYEALTKSAKSISDSDFARNTANLYNRVEGFAGLSITLGDNLTTVQSLLTGYIKELIRKGTIKNALEFDIIAEVKKGLDQDALSASENTMSKFNNESSVYAKAKVFRKDWASTVRMLQSFSHNATTNFLIDLGRFRDPMATGVDKREAIKGMVQYSATIGGYGILTYYINDFRLKMARDYYKWRGVIQDNEDLEKAVDQDRGKTAMLIFNGTVFDAMVSRKNVFYGEIAKGIADVGYNMIKNKMQEDKSVMGEETKNTILGKEYAPFYESKYLGTAGSYVQDMERLVEAFTKDDTESDYKYLLSEKQRAAQSFANELDFYGMLTPSKDLRRWASFQRKALRQGKATQLEMDAQNFMVATADPAEGKYSASQIAQAKEYMDEQKSKAKSIGEYTSYINTTVKDFVENRLLKDELLAEAKQYGEGFAKDVLTIKGSSQMKKPIIINNRFPDKTMDSSIMQFMISKKVLSPMDYAMALLIDKKGNPKDAKETDNSVLEAMDRLIEADTYLRVGKIVRDQDGGIKNAMMSEDQALEQLLKAKTELYQKRKARQ